MSYIVTPPEVAVEKTTEIINSKIASKGLDCGFLLPRRQHGEEIQNLQKRIQALETDMTLTQTQLAETTEKLENVNKSLANVGSSFLRHLNLDEFIKLHKVCNFVQF